MRMVLNYTSVKHALCSSNNVLLSVCINYLKILKLENLVSLLLAKSSFVRLDFYNSPFVVVSKSRQCKLGLTYLGVSSNFTSANVFVLLSNI